MCLGGGAWVVAWCLRVHHNTRQPNCRVALSLLFLASASRTAAFVEEKSLVVCSREISFALFEPAPTLHAHTQGMWPARETPRAWGKEGRPAGQARKKEEALAMQLTRTRSPHPTHSHAPHKPRAGSRAGSKEWGWQRQGWTRHLIGMQGRGRAAAMGGSPSGTCQRQGQVRTHAFVPSHPGHMG